MERDRDIYSKKATPPPEKKDFPEVDVTPRDMRLVSVRRTLVFVLFVALLLSLGSWIIHFLDQRSQRDDLEDLTPEELAALSPPRPPSVAVPDMPEVMGDFDEMGTAAPTGMDPAKISEAVGQIRIAQRYLQAQELDRAEIAARRALEIWPDMNAAQSTLGFIHTQRGQFDIAISFLNAALRTDPFSPDTYNTLGAVYLQKGEMSRAEELFQTALQIRPEYVHAYMNLGMLYLVTGRYQIAADYFERTLEDLPDHAGVRNNLAVCLMRVGRYQESREHLQLLIDDLPNEPSWYFNMAITYSEQQNFEEAISWIRQGAEYCSPMEFQRFMADADFNELRKRPEYEEFMQTVFPDIPMPLGS